MKLVIALALTLMLVPAGLRAQEATPTPPSNPLVFDDIAMHCELPAGWIGGGQHKVALDDLADDPETVAIWVTRRGDNIIKMILQQQHFEGTLDVFEDTLEQQIRNQTQDGVVRSKERVALKNGMPGYFITAVSGSGFNTAKSYLFGWADGQRGVAFIITSSVDALDPVTAKKYFSDCRAVAYPADRN
jgi:hypothetical protein